jgi:hypothetical protein
MIVGIHQPNLFPWLGFFNKIYRSDVFVYLDHVENNPRSAIYTKRVKIIANKQEHWLTCGIKSEGEAIFYPINKMKIDNPSRLRDKHIKTIELNYRKSPFYNEVFPLINQFYNHESDLICDRNIAFIESVCDKLYIRSKREMSSKMDIRSSSNQMLIDIINNVKGTLYMPGGGASEYQQDEMFVKNGIGIQPQNFSHPSYPQFNSPTFVPGLSVVDALMNIGFKETEKLVKNEQ